MHFVTETSEQALAQVGERTGCSTSLRRGSGSFLKAVTLARRYTSAGELASVTQAESLSKQREELSHAIWTL